MPVGAVSLRALYLQLDRARAEVVRVRNVNRRALDAVDDAETAMHAIEDQIRAVVESLKLSRGMHPIYAGESVNVIVRMSGRRHIDPELLRSICPDADARGAIKTKVILSSVDSLIEEGVLSKEEVEAITEESATLSPCVIFESSQPATEKQED